MGQHIKGRNLEMGEVAILSEVQLKGKKAKEVSSELIGISTERKNEALNLIANQLIFDTEFLIS